MLLNSPSCRTAAPRMLAVCDMLQRESDLPALQYRSVVEVGDGSQVEGCDDAGSIDRAAAAARVPGT